AGLRWVSKDNNDSIYTVLNAINDAQFRYFTQNGLPTGHDNFNYVVTTWQHRFNEIVHTKTEAYYMWQYNAVLGGTPSRGAAARCRSGGAPGATTPGTARTSGPVNYTMCEL